MLTGRAPGDNVGFHGVHAMSWQNSRRHAPRKCSLRSLRRGARRAAGASPECPFPYIQQLTDVRAPESRNAGDGFLR